VYLLNSVLPDEYSFSIKYLGGGIVEGIVAFVTLVRVIVTL
jgi:hypothetical protein